MTTEVCDRGGDADVLGLGVRLGVYLSVGALLVGSPMMKSVQALKAAITSSLPLAIALLLVVTRQTASGSIRDFGFIASTYVLFTHFMGASAVIATLVLSGHKRAGYGVIAILVNLWWLTLSLWFWAAGYGSMRKPGCGTTYVYFFLQTPAYGVIRIWFVSATCIGIIIAGFFLYYLVRPTAEGTRKKLRMVFSGDVEGLQRLSRENSEEKYKIRIISVSVSGSAALLYAFAIYGAEYTISWNQMEGVGTLASTGQLLAFISGLVTLLITVEKLVMWLVVWCYTAGGGCNRRVDGNAGDGGAEGEQQAAMTSQQDVEMARAARDDGPGWQATNPPLCEVLPGRGPQAGSDDVSSATDKAVNA